MNKRDVDPVDREMETTGGDTRERLLAAGLTLFADRGFDGVAVRDIAKAAEANVAAVNYHFGGKRDLYHAVVQRIIDDTEPVFGPMRERLDVGIAEAAGDRAALRDLVRFVVTQLLTRLIVAPQMRLRMALIMREYTNPTDAFDIFYERRVRYMHEILTRITAAATGQDADDTETVLLAHTIIGQILGFGIARNVLWRRLDWNDYTEERMTVITEVVSRSVCASLNLSTNEERSRS